MSNESSFISKKSDKDTKSNIVYVKPKANGWLASYIIFSLPGFLSGLIWLLISMFILVAIGGVAAATSETVEEDSLSYSTLVDENTDDSVLIYTLEGPISTSPDSSGGSLNENIFTDVVQSDFEDIIDDEDIKNVVFRIKTGGGTVFASEVLGDLIQKVLDAKNQEQAVFYYDEIVASGGVYASNKVKNYIVGSPYGQTGSIGVVAYIPNLEGLAEKVGYKQTVIKSSASKDYGNPLRDLTTEEQEFLQSQVDNSYNDFLNIVATGRGLEKGEVEQFATGFVYENSEALQLGLLNELGSIDTAVEKAAELAGLERYNVLEADPKEELFSLFGGGSLVEAITASVFSSEQLLTQEEFIKPGRVYMVDPLLIQ